MSEPCDFCSWYMVTKTTEAAARPLAELEHRHAVRVFRCAVCGRELETPVSRAHEIIWRDKPKPGPMPDQLRIHDVI